MSATRVRASALFVAVSMAACAACGGDARRASPSEPLVGPDRHVPAEVRAFAARRSRRSLQFGAARRGGVGRPAACSSSPSRWSKSEDGRKLIVTLRGDVRFHTGDPITAPVVRDLLAKKIAHPSGNQPASRRSTIGACSSHCARPPRSSRRPEHDARRQQRCREDRAAHRARSSSSPPSRWCSSGSTATTRGSLRSSAWRFASTPRIARRGPG